jgi:hypothetical protein
MFNEARVQNLLIAFLLLIVVGMIWTGYHKGHNNAIASAVSNNAEAIAKGVTYFYADQERYPTTIEIQDTQLMARYITPFPVKEITTSHCPQSYIYRNPDQKHYELLFCIPRASGVYAKEWNRIGTN